MAAEYKLQLSDASGVLQYELTEFQSLAYVNVVNRPGLCRFTLSGQHAAIGTIADKWQVAVSRRNKEQDIDWAVDFRGLLRGQQQQGVRPGVFFGRCPGWLSMLGWRLVAFPAGTADRSTFTGVEAETIMKTLVDYNAGSNATTGNDRLRTGTITGLSVETDGGNGNVLDFVCPGQNLLEALQDLALIGGGDFDLVKTGAATWQFRWYTGQLGTDRSADVIFAVGYDNMSDPAFEIDHNQERTVAIVAGQGEGAAREFAIRTGPDYDVDDNNIEMFVDARDIAAGDTDALNDRGDRKLEERRALEMFDFEVQQTAALAYGRDYFLGDLVTAVSPFTGNAVTKKIQAVTVTVERSGERIEIGLQDE
jgi:hypothetical protein